MNREPLAPVRLTEIPYRQRMSAAREAAKECHTDDEIASIMFAAMFPSDKLYWIRQPEPLRAAA